MKGVSRFDFYPKNWIGDTRGISPEARGIYIDLLSLIYSSGGPIPYVKGQASEAELVSVCALKRVTTLRRVLDELTTKGQMRLVDGALFNGRAHEELEKIAKRRGDEPPRKPADNGAEAARKPRDSEIENQPNQQVDQTVLSESERPESESNKKEIQDSLPRATRALKGPSRATKAARREIWQQHIIRELRAVLPSNDCLRLVTAYAAGERWARECFEQADRALKAGTLIHVSVPPDPGEAPQSSYVPHMPPRPSRRANGEGSRA